MESKKNILKEQIVAQTSEESVGPPLLPLKKTFKSIEDWLVNICDSGKPQKPIAEYALGLFQSQEDYILYLVGQNTSNNRTTIDFKPSNMYFQLPKDEYLNLNRTKVINKLSANLIGFTKTSQFKTSFLSDANFIVIEGRVVIWSK